LSGAINHAELPLGYKLRNRAALTQPITSHEADPQLVAAKEIQWKGKNLPTSVGRVSNFGLSSAPRLAKKGLIMDIPFSLFA